MSDYADDPTSMNQYGGGQDQVSTGPSTEFMNPTAGFAEGVINQDGFTIRRKPQAMLVLDDDPFGIRGKRNAAANGLAAPEDNYVDKLFIFGKEFSRESLGSIAGGSELVTIAERNRRGKKGFLAGLFEDLSPFEILPYVNDASAIGTSVNDMLTVRDTFKKLQDGEQVTDEELVKTRLYMARAERDASGNWAAGVASVVRAAPAFALEMFADASTFGVGVAASVGTRGTAKALSSTAKKQMSLFVREYADDAIRRSLTEAGEQYSKAAVKAYASKMDTKAVDGIVANAMKKMVATAKDVPELEHLLKVPGIDDAFSKYAKSAAELQINRIANPSAVKASWDFLAEYGGRALTDHGADALWALPKLKRDSIREAAGNFIFEAPIRGALYMAYDQGIMHPIIGAVSGNGLGFDTTATQAENQLRMSAMVRGDRDLMANAKAVSLGMSWMEMSSEMTGRGFSMLTGMAKDYARPLVKAVAGHLPLRAEAGLQGSALSKLMDLEIGSDSALKAKLAERTRVRVADAISGKAPIKGFAFDAANPISVETALAKMPGLEQAALKASIAQEKGIKFFQIWAAEKMVNGGFTPTGINRMMKKMGYDEIFEEMLEERYNGFAQGLLGLTDQEHDGVAQHMALMYKGLMPGWEQLSTELVSFSLPSIARSALFRAQAALGAGGLAPFREIGEDLDILSATGNIGIIGDVLSGKASIADIAVADTESETERAKDALGRVKATPEVIQRSLARLQKNLAYAGMVRSEFVETTPSNIWRKGLSSVFGIANAVISGNPMMAFADPVAATLKDYGTGPNLVNSLSTVYAWLRDKERGARATAAANIHLADQAGVVASEEAKSLDNASLQEAIMPTYSAVVNTFVTAEMARRGVITISDEMLKEQVALISKSAGGNLQVNGESRTETEFYDHYKDQVKAVLEGKARAIKSGTNFRFEYYSLADREGTASTRIVQDSEIRGSIAALLGMQDVLETRVIEEGMAHQLLTYDTPPFDPALLAEVAKEVEGSPLTQSTVNLMTRLAASTLTHLGSGKGGMARLESFANEVRATARTFQRENTERLAPFYAAMDVHGGVGMSYKLRPSATRAGKVEMYAIYNVPNIADGQVFDNEVVANAAAKQNLDTANGAVKDPMAHFADFMQVSPKVHLTNEAVIQVSTAAEALAVISAGYKSEMSQKHKLHISDPDYVAKIKDIMEQDRLADQYSLERKASHEAIVAKLGQEKADTMLEAFTARYGKDGDGTGYETARQKILKASGVRKQLSQIDPTRGYVYVMPQAASSTVSDIKVPLNLMSNMTALLEETTETNLRAAMGIVFEKGTEQFVAPIEIMVNAARGLATIRAAAFQEMARMETNPVKRDLHLATAAKFANLANNIFTSEANIEAFSKLAVGVALYRGDVYKARGSHDTRALYYREIGELADDLRSNEAFPAFASIVDRVRGGQGFTNQDQKSTDGLMAVLQDYKGTSEETNKVFLKAKAELSAAAGKVRSFAKENGIAYSSSDSAAEVAYVRATVGGGNVNVGATPAKASKSKTAAPAQAEEVGTDRVGPLVAPVSESQFTQVDPDVAERSYAAFYEFAKAMKLTGSESALRLATTAFGAGSEDTIRGIVASAVNARSAASNLAEMVAEADGFQDDGEDETATNDPDSDSSAQWLPNAHSNALVNSKLMKTFASVVGMEFPAVNGHPVSLKRMLIDGMASAPKALETVVGMLSPHLRTAPLEQHGSMEEPNSPEFSAWLDKARKAVEEAGVPKSRYEALFAVLKVLRRSEKLNLFGRLGSAIATGGALISRSIDGKSVTLIPASARVANGAVYASLATGLRAQLDANKGGWTDAVNKAIDGLSARTRELPGELARLKVDSSRPAATTEAYKRLLKSTDGDRPTILAEFYSRALEFAKVTDAMFGKGNALSDALRDRGTLNFLLGDGEGSKKSDNAFKALYEDFMYATGAGGKRYDAHMETTLRSVVAKITGLAAIFDKATDTVHWKTPALDDIFAELQLRLSTGIRADAKNISDAGTWLRSFATILNGYANVNPPTVVARPGGKSAFLVQAGAPAAIHRFITSQEFLDINRAIPGFEKLDDKDPAFKMARATCTYVDGTPVMVVIAGETVTSAEGATISKTPDASPMNVFKSLRKDYNDGNSPYVTLMMFTGDRSRSMALNIPRAYTHANAEGKVVEGAERQPFSEFSRNMYKKLLMDRLEPKRHPVLINNGFAIDVPGKVTMAVVVNGFAGTAGESTNGMEAWFGKLREAHKTYSPANGSDIGKYHLIDPATGEFHKSSQIMIGQDHRGLGDSANWHTLGYTDLAGDWDSANGSLNATDMANIKTGFLTSILTINGKDMKLIDYVLALHKESGNNEAAWAPSTGEESKSLADTIVSVRFKGGARVNSAKLSDLLPNIRVVNRPFAGGQPMPVILYDREGMRMQEAANLYKSAKPHRNILGVNLIKDACHLYGMEKFLGLFGMRTIKEANKEIATNPLAVLGATAQEKLALLSAAGWGPNSGPYQAEMAVALASKLRNRIRFTSYGLLAVQTSSGMRCTGMDPLTGQPIIDGLVNSQHEKDMLFVPEVIGPERADLFGEQTTVSGLARLNVIDRAQRYLMWAKGDGTNLVGEFAKEFGEGDFRTIFSKVVLAIVEAEANPEADTSKMRARLFGCFNMWDGKSDFSAKDSSRHMLKDLTYIAKDGTRKFNFTAVFDENVRKLELPSGGQNIAIGGSTLIATRTPSYNNGSNGAVLRLSTPYSLDRENRVKDESAVMIDPVTDRRLGTDHDGDKLSIEMFSADKTGRIYEDDAAAEDGAADEAFVTAAGNYFVAKRANAISNPDLRTLGGKTLVDRAPLIESLNTGTVSAEPFGAVGMSQLKGTRDATYKKLTGEDYTFSLQMTNAEWLAQLTGEAVDTAKGRGIGVMWANILNDAVRNGVNVRQLSDNAIKSTFIAGVIKTMIKRVSKARDQGEEVAGVNVEFLQNKVGPLIEEAFGWQSSMLRKPDGSSYMKLGGHSPLFAPPSDVPSFDKATWALKSKVIDGINNAMFDALKELLAPSLGWNTVGVEPLFVSLMMSHYKTEAEYVHHISSFVEWLYSSGAQYMAALKFRNGLDEGKSLFLNSKGEIPSVADAHKVTLSDDEKKNASLQEAAKEALELLTGAFEMIRVATPTFIRGQDDRQRDMAQMVLRSLVDGNAISTAVTSALSLYRLLLTGAAVQKSIEGLSLERFSIGTYAEAEKMVDRADATMIESPALGVSGLPEEGAEKRRPIRAKVASEYGKAAQELFRNTHRALMSKVLKGDKLVPVSDVARDRMKLINSNEEERDYSTANLRVGDNYSIDISEEEMMELRTATIPNSLAVMSLMVDELGDERTTAIFNTLRGAAPSIGSNTLNVKLAIEALMGAYANEEMLSVKPVNGAIVNLRLPSAGNHGNLATLRAPDSDLSTRKSHNEAMSRMLSGAADEGREPLTGTIQRTAGFSKETIGTVSGITRKELAFLMAFYGASTASDVDMTPNTVLAMFGPELIGAMSTRANELVHSSFMALPEYLADFPMQLANGQMFESIPEQFVGSGQPTVAAYLANLRVEAPAAEAPGVKVSMLAHDTLIRDQTRATELNRASVSHGDSAMRDALLHVAGNLHERLLNAPAKANFGPIMYDALDANEKKMKTKSFSPAPPVKMSLFRSLLAEIVSRANMTHHNTSVIAAAVDYMEKLNIGMASSDGSVVVDPTVIIAASWLSRVSATLENTDKSAEAHARLLARLSESGLPDVPAAHSENLLAIVTVMLKELGVSNFEALANIGPKGRVAMTTVMTAAVNAASPRPIARLLTLDPTSAYNEYKQIVRESYDKAGKPTFEAAPKAVEPAVKKPTAPVTLSAPVVANVKPAKSTFSSFDQLSLGEKVDSPAGAVVANTPSPIGAMANLPASVAMKAYTEVPVTVQAAVAAGAVRETASLAERPHVKPAPAQNTTQRTTFSRTKFTPVLSRAITAEDPKSVLTSAIEDSTMKYGGDSVMVVSLNMTRPKYKGETSWVPVFGPALLNQQRKEETPIDPSIVNEHTNTLADINADPKAEGARMAREVLLDITARQQAKGFALSFAGLSNIELARQGEHEKQPYSQDKLLLFAHSFITTLKANGLKKVALFNMAGMNWALEIAAYHSNLNVSTSVYDMYDPSKDPPKNVTVLSSARGQEHAIRGKHLLGYTINQAVGAPVLNFTTRARAFLAIQARRLDDMLPVTRNGVEVLKGITDLRSLDQLEGIRRAWACIDLHDRPGLARNAWDATQEDNFRLLERLIETSAREGRVAAHLAVLGALPESVAYGTELAVRAPDVTYGADLKNVRGIEMDVLAYKTAVIFTVSPDATVDNNPIIATKLAMGLGSEITYAVGEPKKLATALYPKGAGVDLAVVFSENAGKVRLTGATHDLNNEFKMVAVADLPVELNMTKGRTAADGSPLPRAFQGVSNSMLAFRNDVADMDDQLDELMANATPADIRRLAVKTLAIKTGFVEAFVVELRKHGIDVSDVGGILDVMYSIYSLAASDVDKTLYKKLTPFIKAAAKRFDLSAVEMAATGVERSVAMVSTWIKSFPPALADRIDVLEELPEYMREQTTARAERSGIEAVTNAFYEPATGRVSLVAPYIGSKDLAIRLVLHELTHKGVFSLAEAIGGELDLFTLLQGVKAELLAHGEELAQQSGYAGFADLVSSYGFDDSTIRGENELLSELLARYAERFADKPKTLWFKTLIQSIGEWIKKYVGIDLAPKDLDALVARTLMFSFKASPATSSASVEYNKVAVNRIANEMVSWAKNRITADSAKVNAFVSEVASRTGMTEAAVRASVVAGDVDMTKVTFPETLGADSNEGPVTTSFDRDGLPVHRSLEATSNSLLEFADMKAEAEQELGPVISGILKQNPSNPLWRAIFQKIDEAYKRVGMEVTRGPATERLVKALMEYYNNQEHSSFSETSAEDKDRTDTWAMSMAGAIMRLSRGSGYDSFDKAYDRLGEVLNRALVSGDPLAKSLATRAIGIRKMISEYGFTGATLQAVEDEVDSIRAYREKSTKEGTENQLRELADTVVDSLLLLANYKYHASESRIADPIGAWDGSITDLEVNTPEQDAVFGNVVADKNLYPVHRSYRFKLADYESWFDSVIRPTFMGANVRDIMTDGSVKAALVGVFDDLTFWHDYLLGNEMGVLKRYTKGKTSLGARDGRIGNFSEDEREFGKLERTQIRKGGELGEIRLEREFKDASGNIVEDSKSLMHFVLSCIDNLLSTVHDTGRNPSIITGLKLNFADLKSRHGSVFATEMFGADPDSLRAKVSEFFSEANIQKRMTSTGEGKKQLDMDIAFSRITQFIPKCQVATGVSLADTLREKMIDITVDMLRFEQQDVAAELYQSGWIVKQTTVEEGVQKFSNLALTIPMEMIDQIFMASEARRVLVKAGRNEADLTMAAMAEHIRPLMARIHRSAITSPWVTHGLASGLTAANSSAPFFRGSAARDYNDRNGADLRPLPTADERLDEETQSMMRTIAASLTRDYADRDHVITGVRDLKDSPPRMIRYMCDLFGLGHKDVPVFIKEVEEGVFEDGSMGFRLAKDATMADLAALLYAKSVQTVAEQRDSVDGRSITIASVPLNAYIRAYDAALLVSDFKNGVPGLTAYQAYEQDGSLPAGNYTVLDRIQLYANELAGAEELRGTMAQMLMSTDAYGNPLYLANPADSSDAVDAIPDEMWGVLSRWWSSHFGVSYDMLKSGRENAREIYGKIADLQRFQGNTQVQYSKDGVEVTGYHHMTKTGLSSISGFLCRLDEPWDDTKAFLNVLSNGEAAGMMAQLLRAKKSVHTSSFSGIMDSMLSWSKSMSVMGSVFFTIATKYESPWAAVGPTYWKIFNRDPNFVGYKDMVDMIGSNDPFFRDLKIATMLQGITTSDKSQNPVEHFTRGTVDRDIRRLTRIVKANVGNDAANRLNAVLKGALQSSSEHAFEYMINATTMAVAAHLNNKFRLQAIAQGKPWDPIYSMRKWATYVSSEVGGVNPAIFPFMTPRVQKALTWGMFSWSWSIGAWMAGGGDVLTQKFFGQTSNPEVRNFMFGRWFRMYTGIMIGVPLVMQAVSTAIGKAFGVADDDDEWFIGNNEKKAKFYGADLTPALKAIAKIPGVENFKASGGNLPFLPSAVNAALSPVTGTAAKLLPAYTGTDASNTTGRRRIYFHLGKQGWEVLRWFEAPWEQAVSKLTMPVQKFLDAGLGFQISSGRAMPWSEQSIGEKLTTFRGQSAMKHFLTSFMPFSVQGMVDKGDVGMLGMVGPTAYGVGQTASIAEMKKVFDIFADPDHYKRVYASRNMYNDLIAKVRDEMEDARRNGLDPERMMKFALGQAREPYYRQVYDALPKSPAGKADDKELSMAMRSLYRLWFTEEALLRSVKSRYAKTNLTLDNMPLEMRQQMMGAMQEAMANPTGEEDAARAVRRAERGGAVASVVKTLATDDFPTSVLGYRVVGPDELSPEDEAFFSENPDAAGYYSMTDAEPKAEAPPASAPEPIEPEEQEEGAE